MVPGKPDPPATAVVLPRSQLTAGQMGAVWVQLRDAFGNAIANSRRTDFNGTALSGPVDLNATTGDIRSARELFID